MSLQKELPGVFVGGNTLKKCQDIARLVGDLLIKQRWTQKRVNTHNFLEQRGNGANRVPNVRS